MKKLAENKLFFWEIILVGIALRFLAMTFGHNYDFESYCIVGKIAARLGNVYAETFRYNYAPVFYFIQGTLYRISMCFTKTESVYRVLMVSALTAADLGITGFLAKRYDVLKALCFFLNPVSVIITGYHNQFDNIAVLFALISIVFYNEEKRFQKRDWLFLLFFSLSLMTKHIFIIFLLFILVKQGLPIKKRLVYCAVPPAAFLISFLPFALNHDGRQAILRNVFFYTSSNSFPLLGWLLKLIGVPAQSFIFFFAAFMVLSAFIVRKKPFEEMLLLYTVMLVAFSSAITNQYFVIPLAAIFILNTGWWKYVYQLIGFLYLLVDTNGFHLLDLILFSALPKSFIFIATQFNIFGYRIVAWCLFFILLHGLGVFEPLKRNKACKKGTAQ